MKHQISLSMLSSSSTLQWIKALRRCKHVVFATEDRIAAE